MGLGLPLVREGIRKHGGAISIGNETWHMRRGNIDGPSSVVCCRFELPLLSRPVKSEAPQDDVLGADVELF